MNVNSPIPGTGTMPPPNLKRPRQSAAGSGPSTASTSRVKRRKNELDDGAGEGSEAGGRGRGGSGLGGKGKDEEGGEGAEGQIKIDFRTLPESTLYKYLEYHDLLPRWEVSPWSEDLSMAPHELYKSAPPTATGGPSTEDPTTRTSPLIPQKPDLPSDHADTTNGVLDSQTTEDLNINGTGGEATHVSEGSDDTPEQVVVAPTTRSKTAPLRKEPTPVPRKVDPIITLSDIHTARDVLADKANAHWQKGLGGGQNKEGETIVNFLYKLKVGSGRLLKVYNPPPTAQ